MSPTAAGETAQAVAVIGMAGRFPGADNVDAFWENLRNGTESITFFSNEQLAKAGVPPSNYEAPNYVPARGVAEGLDLFDAGFFGYSPREAGLMDPQQRVFLECAWEALESSGIDPERYEGLIGVYGGTSISTYLINNLAHAFGGIGPDSLWIVAANDKDHAPTRVSYKLNLKGPSVNVQTACSTSLVATHLACQSLLNGECDAAMAGGASVTVPIEAGYLYEEGSIASPDGHCRAFDAQAKGTVGGSGVAIVVLKRLDDAIADGDSIHAIILGSAINNDGSGKVGYTAPSVEGQANVIAQAQAVAGVDPDSIGYIEAHGTGTILGDPIEVAALTQAFRAGTDRSGFCALGAVKTNVGHLDAAAGATGLIKTILTLRHRELPPSLHFKQPNPQIEFQQTPFHVNTELSPWDTEGAPRRAGVSSFGVGGTNAHLVLQEAAPAESSTPSRPWQLLVLSARSSAALATATENLAGYFEGNGNGSLGDVAHTLQTGRRRFDHRRMIVCRDGDDVATALRGLDPRRSATAASKTSDRPVVFMFPGQGAQHVDMGKGLYESESTFRHHVDHCAERLKPAIGLDLRDLVFSANDDSTCPNELRRTFMAQPALFMLEYALARLWMEWGIHPRAMIGHSIGEYVAACLAGVFPLEDALVLVATRARMMEAQPEGAMTAVPLGPDDVAPYLVEDVGIAAINEPGSCVLSGPIASVKRVEARLDTDGVGWRRLHTSHAFHSSMMDSIVAPFAAEVASVELRPPRLPFVSGVTGTWITDEEATDPVYWARHLREPVRFAAGMDRLLRDGDQVLLEVGPGNTLATLASRHPGGSKTTAVLASMRHPHREEADTACLLTALGRLWVLGASIDWTAFYRHESRRKIPLPTYPFEHQRYWVEPAEHVVEPQSARSEPEIGDWFYIPSWKRSAPPEFFHSAAVARQPSCWLIFMDSLGVGERLVVRLKELGQEVIAVTAGTAFSKCRDHRIAINPHLPDDYRSLLEECKQLGHMPDQVVHMWGVDGTGGALDPESVQAAQGWGFYSTLYLAQALGHHEEDWEHLRIAVVTTDLHDVVGNEHLRPEKATVLGLCRVLPQEYPNLTCRHIDLVAGEAVDWDDARSDQFLTDLASFWQDDVVAYRGSQRWVQRYEPVRLQETTRSGRSLREGGVYMITGGLGNIALDLAEHLARTLRPTLILVGRRGVPDKEEWDVWTAEETPLDRPDGEAEERERIRKTIRRLRSLERLGARVRVFTADVGDIEQMRIVVDTVYREFQALHGVIHAAMVLNDGAVIGKDFGTVESVLSPKINGTLVLDRLFRDKPLDFLVLLSSLRALVGGAGLVDYSAACNFLDAFALWSRANRPDRVTVSINLNAWWSAPPTAPSIGRRMPPGEIRLAKGISAEQGADVFRRVVANDLPQIAVCTEDLDALIKHCFSTTTPPSWREANEPDDLPPEEKRHARPALESSYVAPENDVQRTLASAWENAIGIDRVGINDNFFDLGGDSIIGLQIAARARQAGVRVTSAQLFEHQTIAELAAVATAERSDDGQDDNPTGPLPLAPIQCWFFEQRLQEPHHFTFPILLEVEAPMDRPRLEEALRRLVERHDALRLRFRHGKGRWSQEVDQADVDLRLDFVDLSEAPHAQQRRFFDDQASEFHASLDLSSGPLLRFVYFHLGGEHRDRLLLLAHHLLVDHGSWQILLDELETLCQRSDYDCLPALPTKTASFARWVRQLTEDAASPEIEEELAFWHSLAAVDVPLVPRDFRQGANTFGSLENVTATLDPEATQILIREVPRAYGARIEEALVAVLSHSLAQWIGSATVLLDLEGNGRDAHVGGLDVSRTVGWFTTLFPMVLRVDDPQEPDIVRAIQRQLRKIPNGGIGYGLLRYLSSQPDVVEAMRSMPQPEVAFSYLGGSREVATGAKRFSHSLDSAGAPAAACDARQHLIQVGARISDGALRMDWLYSRSVHERATISNLARDFVARLEAHLEEMRSSAEQLRPADFPAAGLNQQDLDRFLDSISPTRQDGSS